MLKRALFSSLFVVLTGCVGEKIVGDAYDAGAGSDSETNDSNASDPDLVAAAQSLSGDWLSPPNLVQLIFDVGPLTLTFKPNNDGSAGGTYRAMCPGGCNFHEAPDGGTGRGFGSIDFDRGEYLLVGVTSKERVRGVLYSDDFTLGLSFELGSSKTPPDQIFLDFLPGSSVPMERIASGSAHEP
jgi:hypothetical protein